MAKNKNNNKKGATLIIVIMVFAVLMVVGTAALRIMSTETTLAINSYDQTKAYYVAKSGADTTAAYILDNPDKLEDLANKNSNVTKLDADSSFIVTVTELENTVEIVSVGEVKSGVKANVTVTLKYESDDFTPEAALYINEQATLNNKGQVIGDIVMAKNNTIITYEKKLIQKKMVI